MRKNIPVTALLFAIPLISTAASVPDLSLLNSPSQTTLSQLQQHSDTIEKTHINDGQLEKTNFGQETEAYIILEKHKIVNNAAIQQQHINTTQDNYNLLGILHEHIVSSDDMTWRELSSSIKDTNDALNKVNDWAGNVLNNYIDNTNLSSINFRSAVLQQQNTNIKTYIAEQDSDDDLLSGSHGAPYGTYANRPEFLVGIINIFTTPTLLLKVLAENFSIIAVVLTLSLGFKLLMKFVVHKTQKRKHRSKSKRKRSIDGFIKD